MEWEARTVVLAGIAGSWDSKANSLWLDHWNHKGNNSDLKLAPIPGPLLWDLPGMDCRDRSLCWEGVALLVLVLEDCLDRGCN